MIITVLAFIAHARRADRRPRVRPLPRRGRLRRARCCASRSASAACSGAASRRPTSTEFVVCALPLGGYVRMLDEREGAGARRTSSRRAFNRKPLLAARRDRRRRPDRQPAAGGAAVRGGALDRHRRAEGAARRRRRRRASPSAPACAPATGCAPGRSDGGDWHDVRSMTDLRWQVTQAVLHGEDVAPAASATATAAASAASSSRSTSLGVARVDAKLMQRIGLGSAVQRAGARRGQGRRRRRARRACAPATACSRSTASPIADASAGCATRSAPAAASGSRACRCTGASSAPAQRSSSTCTPASSIDAGSRIGRIEAFPGQPPEMVTVRYGAVDGLTQRRDADLGDVGADGEDARQDGRSARPR